MKKIITLLAVSVGLAAFAPVNSQAFDGRGRGSNLSFYNHCNSCGTAVYRERVVVGRDRHGCPIFGYRTVSHVCRPVSHHHGHSHGGFGGHFGGRPGHR